MTPFSYYERLVAVETRFESMEEKVDKMDGKVDQLDSKLDEVLLKLAAASRSMHPTPGAGITISKTTLTALGTLAGSMFTWLMQYLAK